MALEKEFKYERHLGFNILKLSFTFLHEERMPQMKLEINDWKNLKIVNS